MRGEFESRAWSGRCDENISLFKQNLGSGRTELLHLSPGEDVIGSRDWLTQFDACFCARMVSLRVLRQQLSMEGERFGKNDCAVCGGQRRVGVQSKSR